MLEVRDYRWSTKLHSKAYGLSHPEAEVGLKELGSLKKGLVAREKRAEDP